jgi:hypothetical protein
VAGLALDGVVAVARIPREAVVAGAQEPGVVAAGAVDGVSSPCPPRSTSSPSPPTSVSLPGPPSIVSRPSAARPVEPEIASAPEPAATLIAVNVAASTLKSGVPSAPTSTWSVVGAPGASRNATVSALAAPVISSVPARTCACTGVAEAAMVWSAARPNVAARQTPATAVAASARRPAG